jgi:hypothetical protein
MKKRPSKAYKDGYAAAMTRQALIERYNASPPDNCPYQKGTPEEADYDRGWKAAMAERISDER